MKTTDLTSQLRNISKQSITGLSKSQAAKARKILLDLGYTKTDAASERGRTWTRFNKDRKVVFVWSNYSLVSRNRVAPKFFNVSQSSARP
ncbi:MAG: hypothetical protein ABI623_04765 [bacterium]